MAQTVYDYLRTDTLYDTVAVGKLAADITTHPWITETLISVTMPDPDSIAIKFANALSALEKARVDGMVAGHEGTDLKFKRLASRGVAGLEVSLNDGPMAPIDGFVIDPLELTGTVARLKVRLSGEWKAVGAGAQLQVIETADASNEDKFSAPIAVADTGGAWAFFTVDSDVALRDPGAAPNRYRLDGKRSGGTAASIRYCELALVWV
ncbi:hypothetical protein LCGC14_0605650 [marine sediment metagenome]|uniref:Uncharacterized protein n=2 Tax=root TaxID=1 RepID=A0A9C9NIA6_9HYPH|nr:hypothetical protein [Aurantimonas coralicida]